MSSAAPIHSLAEGTIRLTDAPRISAVSARSLSKLDREVRASLGAAAPDMFYRSGYEWGLQEMVYARRSVRTAAPGDRPLPDFAPILQAWWSPLESQGWGAASFDLSAASRGLVFIDLRESPVAAAASGAERPVCHLYAGMFAAAVSFVSRSECHAVEIQCRALGQASCRFVAGSGAEIDFAELWRQQGTPASEIIRRLR